MSGHGEQNPRPGRGGPSPRPGLGGPYHGAPPPSASHFRPSRPPPPNAAALGQFEAASHQYLPAPASHQYAPAPASHQYAPARSHQYAPAPAPASHQYASAPASHQYPYAPRFWPPPPFWPPGLPPFAQSQPPPSAGLVNPALQFRPPGPRQEEPFAGSQQPLRLQPSPSPPPRPWSTPAPAAPSPPPPSPSPMPSRPSSPGTRHSEDEHHRPPKRVRSVTLEMKYMSVLDFFDEHPVTEPYKFEVGSLFGDIPQAEHTRTTYIGATVLDGYVEFFFKLHADNKSFGGKFDVSDMLVSAEDPLHVTVNKRAKMKASRVNIRKDLMKLLSSLVKTRYGEAGNRPAYVDDFISRVENLSPESDVEEEAWEIQLWVIRHHPLLIEPANRGLLLSDFYRFCKTLDRTAAEQLIEKVNKFCHPRSHVFTAPKDKFISAICRESHQNTDPDLHEEHRHYYPFSGEDGYLAMFLHCFIVCGPEVALASGIELAELELIVARYFGKVFPSFLEEMSSATDKHEMLEEILTMYAERRSVSRRALG